MEDEIVHWVAPDPSMDTTAELNVREGGDYAIHLGPHTVRGTNMRLFHEQLPTEESREQHEQGWTGSFARLEQHLADAS